MPKLDEQISTLQERLTQLKLRHSAASGQARPRQAQRERKAETRRKFVVGGVILDKVRSGEFDQARLRDWLDGALSRKEDRALFDLPPRPE